MKVLPYLLRLMTRVRLSPAILVRLGPEDRLAIDFADACRVWTLEGRLRCVWWHNANEAGGGSDKKKRQIQMVKAVALGLIPGTADLVFIGWGQSNRLEDETVHRVLLLELKSKTGAMSPNQKDFRDWAESCGIDYRLAKTFEQAETALIETGLLQPRRSTAHAL